MSLISEALRKARQEGRLRDGRRWGVPTTTPQLPGGGRRGISGLAVLVLALLGSVVGAAVVYLLLTHPGPDILRVSAGAKVSAEQPTVAPGMATVAAGQGKIPTKPAVRISVANPSADGAGGGDTIQPAAPVPTAAVSPSAAGTAAGGGTGGASRGDAESSVNLRERSFVLDADLGNVKLHLDFLVYKPSAPFASVNGQQVVPGSIISGFRVDEIGPDAVRLSDSRTRVVLRVR
jgi:hypothetical protein